MLANIWNAIKKVSASVFAGELIDNISNYLITTNEVLLVTELLVEDINGLISKYTNLGIPIDYKNSILAYTSKPYSGKAINKFEYYIKTAYNGEESLGIYLHLTPKQDGTLISFKFSPSMYYYYALTFFGIFAFYFLLLFTPLTMHYLLHVGMWLLLPLAWFQRMYSADLRKKTVSFWKTAFYAQMAEKNTINSTTEFSI